MTAQGHPRRVFATAIERGNIVMAEATARELGRISLEEALVLTALVAEKDMERRFAVRWLRRLLEDRRNREGARGAPPPGRSPTTGR